MRICVRTDSPNSTQVDMELSFVDVDDVIAVNEKLLKYICKEAIGLEVELQSSV